MRFTVQRDIIPIYECGAGIQAPFYGTVRYEPGDIHYYIDGIEVNKEEFVDEYYNFATEQWIKL